MKNPLERLVLERLGTPFYFNIVKFPNEEKWCPLWGDWWRYAGSDNHRRAVRLRHELCKELQRVGNPEWSEKDFRTVRMELYARK